MTDPKRGDLEAEEAPEQTTTDPAVQHSRDLAALIEAKRAYQTEMVRRLHPRVPPETKENP